MDRNVFFGTESVPQWPSNLPTFASFLGHDIEGHEAFYTNHPVNIEASDFGALGEQLQDTHEMFQTLLLAREHGSISRLENRDEVPQERDYPGDDLVFFLQRGRIQRPAIVYTRDRSRGFYVDHTTAPDAVRSFDYHC
jgi:hypothetical protein